MDPGFMGHTGGYIFILLVISSRFSIIPEVSGIDPARRVMEYGGFFIPAGIVGINALDGISNFF
jgi:hypothetical protein